MAKKINANSPKVVAAVAEDTYDELFICKLVFMQKTVDGAGIIRAFVQPAKTVGADLIAEAGDDKVRVIETAAPFAAAVADPTGPVAVFLDAIEAFVHSQENPPA